MRKAICAGVACAALALVPSALGTTLWGVPSASQAISARVEQQWPAAHSLFVNCPGKNTVAAGLSCEVRFVVNGRVRTAAGIAEPSKRPAEASSTWSSPGLIVDPGGRQHQVRCGLYGLGPASNQEPLELRALGTSCDLATTAARAMNNFVLVHNLRLPRLFGYTLPEPESLGFIVKSYRCRSTVTTRRTPPGSNQPEVGFEVARCHNRFGDRFRYAFIQGA